MMLTIEEAAKIIQSQNVKRSVIDRLIEDSLGYWLAEEITSPFDLPSFDNSAMDGYAVSGVSESYKITGEIQAGDISAKKLRDGEALRIFTGAKIPDSATAVVMQEKTRVKNNILFVEGEVSEGQHIRRRGNELSSGQTVFKPGHLISPASIGMIGSLGINSLKVYQKPSVRIISTGNELVPPGHTKELGQIYESNSYSLQSALESHGFRCEEKTHIKDDFSAIKQGIEAFLEASDVLLISGGISVGDYDFVKQALEENGVQELFYKVFQKPGKPLYFGRRDDTFVFALPGNPASSLTCFYIHVLPLLQKLSGANSTGLQRLDVPIDHDYDNTSDRPVFLKASIQNGRVSILDRQSSSMIHSMALGNALVFLNEPALISKGEQVQTILI
ncbi:molybdopterin molybdotransferase MoeA [Rhodohalobacter sp. 8-1]|uniref:molybdopterin molybdotransferase MoeA n=1 Tax=Rhodohalobacter sp. 8-1 TaxID=3131972 RepID=UPI0030EF8182